MRQRSRQGLIELPQDSHKSLQLKGYDDGTLLKDSCEFIGTWRQILKVAHELKYLDAMNRGFIL